MKTATSRLTAERYSADTLRLLRRGEFEPAWKHLQTGLAQGILPTPGLGSAKNRPDTVELRIISLLAELNDYYGRYDEAAAALAPWESQSHAGRSILSASGAEPEKTRRSHDEALWKHRRQILYVEHQLAASYYRRQDFDRARARIERCLRFATELLEPIPHSIVKRLLFSQGTLAMRQRRPDAAVTAFRSALLRAEAAYSAKRHGLQQRLNGPLGDVAETAERLRSELLDEERVFRSWVGQVFALGLGQAYLALGNVDEARTIIIGGLLHLNPKDDLHSAYASMVLAKAERLSAGKEAKQQLEEAQKRLRQCRVIFSKHFKNRLSHHDLKAWHESALNAAALGRFSKAKKSLLDLLNRVEEAGDILGGRARWLVKGRLGLSEVARRAGNYAEAKDFAHDARVLAELNGEHALFDETELAEHEAAACAALEAKNDAKILNRVEENLAHLVYRLRDSPLRALPALRLTQIRLKLGDQAGARKAMTEYRSCEPLISVMATRELAAEVSEALNQGRALRLPLDETGDMALNANLKEFVDHLLAALPKKRGSEPWKMLKIPKSTYYEILRAVSQGKVALRASAPRRSKSGAGRS